MKSWPLIIALGLSSTATAAWGQGYPEMPYTPPDEYRLERQSQDHAVLEYWNAFPPSSSYTPIDLSDGDLVVDIEVLITSGPETLTIFPPEGWIAVPPTVEVMDGDGARIDLFRGAWHGS